MQKGIIDFIKENKIATICCTDGDSTPHCFHCFYVLDEDNHLLFFKSSSQTKHSKLLANNPNIAGSILPDKIDLLSLKGIQFSGKIIYSEFPNNIKPDTFYHKKMPFALAKPGHVWCIELTKIKMTDNTKIFGKKLRWEKYEHA